MATAISAITKGDIRELGQRAMVVLQSNSQFETAHINKLSADKALALSLFDVTSNSNMVEADQTLTSLGLNSNSGTSLEYKITRIAFHRANELLSKNDENRPLISKYAKVIEGARNQNLSRAEFEKKLSNGFDRAVTFFRKTLYGDDLDEATKEQKALEHLSADFEEIELDTNITGIEDGSYVELVARIVNGKPVIYGILPKKSDAVKDTIISSWEKAQPKPRKTDAIFQEAGALASVLVADGEATHALIDTKAGITFEAISARAFATIQSVKTEAGFDKQKLSFNGDDLVAISKDLQHVFRKEAIELSVKGKILFAKPIDKDIREIVVSNKMPQHGEVDQDVVVFKIEKSSAIKNSVWHTGKEHKANLSKEQIDHLSKLKIKNASIDVIEGKPIKLDKDTVRIVKRAVKELNKLGDKNITFTVSDQCLSFNTQKDDVSYAVLIAIKA
ncbi:hypothetical protein MTBPR1_100056 [Candidatus Terasakiella magnetica]|uniref:Uncharacterized protein n=1 Tax=Candidatus Terasakiella magnetica TaxID=1867952 RepID=A0A1C3RDS9_9PROT|nr:hypothetical protein [Candidatus Terasakiella magnetica]SCA55415.1 hypothetical protein MTBPR1_100056 [Candidatus Terasakiella magnetica]